MLKLMVIGHLGKDCMMNTVNGKNVINFSVAHTEKFKDNAGVQKEKTIWVECAYWTDRTAIAPYLKKGTQVYVEGNPDLRTYQTQDGRQGASLSLRVNNVQLLGSKQGAGEISAGGEQPAAASTYVQSSTSSSSPANEIAEPADDLPF